MKIKIKLIITKRKREKRINKKQKIIKKKRIQQIKNIKQIKLKNITNLITKYNKQTKLKNSTNLITKYNKQTNLKSSNNLISLIYKSSSYSMIKLLDLINKPNKLLTPINFQIKITKIKSKQSNLFSHVLK